MKRSITFLVCGFIVLVVWFAGGCASPGFKGTPFYTSVEEQPAGAAEDRIWAWPLVYYRDPALSILWPLFEKNDEFIVVRPLFSMYGLNRAKHEYNVLWPLAQWDWETGNHRIFPYFWGHDYRYLFPLYWHADHPLNGKGTDTLFPLWYFNRNAKEYSFWGLGPVLRSKNQNGELGWHVWPVAGHYYDPDDSYHFFAWPLAHRWRRHGNSGADTIIPLYYRKWDGSSRTFISPLWMSQRDNSEAWQCLFPLYYHAKTQTKEKTIFPLGGAGSDDGSRWKCLIPIFYQSADSNASRFLSLPWSQGVARDGSAWQLAFPLYYGSSSVDHSTRLTLLGGKRTMGGRTDWGIVPALSWGTATATNHSAWIAAGLAHHSETESRKSHHVLPLYYASSDSNSSTFISIPYSRSETVSGARWDLAFPLVYRYRSPESVRWITPLAAGGHSGDHSERWHAILPLYFRQQDAAGSSLTTLFGGYHQNESGRHWNAWPLLTWGSGDGDDSDFWALAPLVHVQTTAGKTTTHHVLPLYYWNSRNDSFLSPLAARWRNTESNTVTLVPPALSWKVSAPERKDLWLAGGIAHCSWGEKPGPHHVIPLYYRDRESETFISPFVAKWVLDDETRVTVIPPLLGAGSSSAQGKNLWLLAGLAKASWGDNPGSRYVFPFFYDSPQEHRFISPFFIRSAEASRDTRLYPPLLSLDITEGPRRDIWGLAGLVYRSRDSVSHTSSGYVFPLFYYDSTNTFLSPIIGRHRSKEQGFFYPLTPLAGVRTGDRKGGWLFPLFSHTRNRKSGNVNGMVLWGPYWNDKVKSGACLFPLFYRQRDLAPWDSNGDVASSTYVFPTFWKRASAYTQQETNSTKRIVNSRNMFIPFWSHARTGQLGKRPDVSETSVLLGVWQSKSEQVATPGASDATIQTRKRLLWWLWRYNRHDKNIEVDIFPGISIDRKGNGFRKTAFFYRLYRNEVSTDGKRKMDLLFIPILR